MIDKKAAQLGEWREELDKNSKAVRDTFKTTDGKKVMALLSKHFGSGTVFNTCSLTMARNAGQHEIVQYLEALIERGNKDG